MDIYLAGCQGKSVKVTVDFKNLLSCLMIYSVKDRFSVFTQALVVEQLECGGFFSDVITNVFDTVHDAVLYCLKHQEVVCSWFNNICTH